MAKNVGIKSKWLTPGEVAVYVGCMPEYVYQAVNNGDLKAYVKPWSRGKKIKYLIVHQDDVDGWVRTWDDATGYRNREE